MERKMTSPTTRPEPLQLTKILVWAAAAGRCTFCNRIVTGNDDLGETVPIGELAHNVGWSKNSPRGDNSDLDDDERRSAENLLLLCRTCHKPTDANGVIGRYTVAVLNRMKLEHEARIRFLTSIGGDRKATLVRVVAEVRTAKPELSYDTVLAATTIAGYFPQLLVGSNSAEYDADLRSIAAPGSVDYFATCAAQVADLVNRINDGVRRNDIKHLLVFAFARIPTLVHLGAGLDDKVPTTIFQRQRVDDDNAWRWPENPGPPPTFTIERVSDHGDLVALVVNLSGTIKLDDLAPGVVDTHSVYVLQPESPATSTPTLLDSPAALANFEFAMREFLALTESTHGRIPRVALFPAVPVSAAITIGRVLMPNVSPAWTVFDRNDDGVFFEAIEVKR
jgi:hypothetical protein